MAVLENNFASLSSLQIFGDSSNFSESCCKINNFKWQKKKRIYASLIYFIYLFFNQRIIYWIASCKVQYLSAYNNGSFRHHLFLNPGNPSAKQKCHRCQPGQETNSQLSQETGGSEHLAQIHCPSYPSHDLVFILAQRKRTSSWNTSREKALSFLVIIT